MHLPKALLSCIFFHKVCLIENIYCLAPIYCREEICSEIVARVFLDHLILARWPRGCFLGSEWPQNRLWNWLQAQSDLGRIIPRIGLESQKALKPHRVGSGKHWVLTYFLCPSREVTHGDGENELVSLYGLLCSPQSELQIYNIYIQGQPKSQK